MKNISLIVLILITLLVTAGALPADSRLHRPTDDYRTQTLAPWLRTDVLVVRPQDAGLEFDPDGDGLVDRRHQDMEVYTQYWRTADKLKQMLLAATPPQIHPTVLQFFGLKKPRERDYVALGVETETLLTIDGRQINVSEFVIIAARTDIMFSVELGKIRNEAIEQANTRLQQKHPMIEAEMDQATIEFKSRFVFTQKNTAKLRSMLKRQIRQAAGEFGPMFQTALRETMARHGLQINDRRFSPAARASLQNILQEPLHLTIAGTHDNYMETSPRFNPGMRGAALFTDIFDGHATVADADHIYMTVRANYVIAFEKDAARAAEVVFSVGDDGRLISGTGQQVDRMERVLENAAQSIHSTPTRNYRGNIQFLRSDSIPPDAGISCGQIDARHWERARELARKTGADSDIDRLSAATGAVAPADIAKNARQFYIPFNQAHEALMFTLMGWMQRRQIGCVGRTEGGQTFIRGAKKFPWLALDSDEKIGAVERLILSKGYDAPIPQLGGESFRDLVGALFADESFVREFLRHNGSDVHLAFWLAFCGQRPNLPFKVRLWAVSPVDPGKPAPGAQNASTLLDAQTDWGAIALPDFKNIQVNKGGLTHQHFSVRLPSTTNGGVDINLTWDFPDNAAEWQSMLTLLGLIESIWGKNQTAAPIPQNLNAYLDARNAPENHLTHVELQYKPKQLFRFPMPRGPGEILDMLNILRLISAAQSLPADTAAAVPGPDGKKDGSLLLDGYFRLEIGRHA